MEMHIVCMHNFTPEITSDVMLMVSKPYADGNSSTSI